MVKKLCSLKRFPHKFTNASHTISSKAFLKWHFLFHWLTFLQATILFILIQPSQLGKISLHLGTNYIII